MTVYQLAHCDRAAYSDVLGALQSCVSELVRLRRGRSMAETRLRRVYVCHPFGQDPAGNALKVAFICRSLVESGHLPIAPQVYLPAFVDEDTERELALALCLELVALSDELRVYGEKISAGMRQEIARADALGIPITMEMPS